MKIVVKVAGRYRHVLDGRRVEICQKIFFHFRNTENAVSGAGHGDPYAIGATADKNADNSVARCRVGEFRITGPYLTKRDFSLSDHRLNITIDREGVSTGAPFAAWCRALPFKAIGKGNR